MTMIKKPKCDAPILCNMAKRAFLPDYERYSIYPPLLNLKNKTFLSPLMFGKVTALDDTIIGGAFVIGIGKKGETGAIFIDSIHQKKAWHQGTLSA